MSSSRTGAVALLAFLGLLLLVADYPSRSSGQDLTRAAAGSRGGVGLVSSDPSGTRLLVIAGEPVFRALPPELDGSNENPEEIPEGAVRVDLAGFITAGPPGAPDLPARTVLVAIPSGSRASLSATYEEERDYPGVRVAPVPTPGPRPAAGDLQSWTWIEDPAPYGGPYPEERVSLSPVMQLRDLDVVAVTVWPAIYDPARELVRVAGRIEIEVITEGGEVRRGETGFAPGGEAFGLAEVVNPETARDFRAERPSGVRPGLRRQEASFQSSPNWVKVFVADRGLVRIDGAALAGAGVDLASIDPATLRLFWGGGLDPEPDRSPRSPAAPTFMSECAVRVEWDGNGPLESADSIVFFGQGASGWLDDYRGGPYSLEFREHPSVDHGVYWLTWGGDFPGDPRRIGERDATPTGAAEVDHGLARIHFERNRRYAASPYEPGEKWERWWDANLRDADARVFFPVTPPKPDLNEPGSLKLRLWGYTTMGRGAIHDHYVKVWFNSVPIFAAAGQDTFIWDGPRFNEWGREDVEGEVTLVEGQNRVEIDVLSIFDPANPNRVDEVLVAWFDLGYTRRFDLAGEPGAELVPAGASGPATIVVTSAPAGAEVLDVTDPWAPVALTGTDHQGSTLRFAADLDPQAPAKFLVGTTPAAPARIEVDQSQPNLRDPSVSAWYVVIAHDSMIDAAVRLAESHRSVVPPEGPLPGTTLAVRVSDVYDEFGWGLKSDVAIRNFVDYAVHAWADGPYYICLLGDASYDPRDIFGGGGGETDFVPAPMFWNWIGGSFGGSDYVSDDFYVRTFGDELETPPGPLTDLAVGRLPAGSVEEAEVIVDEKTIPLLRSPEHGPWRQKVILVADDQYGGGEPPRLEGFIHTYNTEYVSEVLPAELERVKVYLVDYEREGREKPAARAAFIQAFNEGAAIINYIGHGAPDVLAHEAVFQIDNVGQLVNGGRLPFFSTYSCTVNRFDEPASEGIGEALVAHSGGGSVASVGSTDFAFISANQALNEGTYERLFIDGNPTRKRTIGVAFGAAKNVLAPNQFDSARKYVLLGDPAIAVPAPDLAMLIDIPAAGARGNAAELVAGVPYQLVATVGGQSPPERWTARVWVRDSEEIRVHGTGVPSGGVTYTVTGRDLFRSLLEVDGDELSAPFVVPVDASQSLTPGRGYAEARVYSHGSSWDAFAADSLFLNVEDALPAEPDSDGGPRIEATFDGGGQTVAPGASLHIRLEDKSGINIVGNTASNDIFMRIDETITVVLSDRFSYDPGSATQGSIDYQLPGLAEGSHTIRIFASDNYLNRSEEEVQFTLSAPGAMAIRRAGLYPNPFEPQEGRGTFVAFEIPEPADVKLRIYAVSGRLIRESFRELERTIDAGSHQIYWDGRDEDGDLVANGVYLCSISAQGLLTGGTADALLRSIVRR